MAKVLVFGHSNSDGSFLNNHEDGWPWVLRKMLAASGIEAEVVHRRIFAGPGAAQIVRDGVEKEQPEVVILATSTFGVVLRLMSNRVRERWGKRPADLFVRGEAFAARRLMGRTHLVARGLRPVRHLTRKVIGTQTTHTPDTLIAHYKDCFSVLAQREDIATIILGGVGYGPAVDRTQPGWEPAQARVYAALKEDALRHRFDWLVLEDLLGGPKDKLKYFYRDGVHTNEASHVVAAEALFPLVAPKLR